MWLDFRAQKTANDGPELWISVHAVTGRAHDPTNQEHARWLLDGTDGVVFVVDSSRARLEDNRAAFANLQQMKAHCRRPPGTTVLLYNKLDLPQDELASIEDLGAALDPRRELAFERGAARTDLGCVIDAIKASVAPCGVTGASR